MRRFLHRYAEAQGGEPIDAISLSGARVLNESECEQQIGVKECFAVATADRTLYLREVRDRKSPLSLNPYVSDN